MDDVPTNLQQSNIPSPTAPPSAVPLQAPLTVFPPGGAGGKETEGTIAFSDELPIDDLGKEMELSHEVAQAGVKIQPTTVQIPFSVQQMGVKPAGSNVTAETIKHVPLTYTQINQGLQQGITSSFRWLAEWCVRKLKQLHLTK